MDKSQILIVIMIVFLLAGIVIAGFLLDRAGEVSEVDQVSSSGEDCVAEGGSIRGTLSVNFNQPYNVICCGSLETIKPL